ncbi:uncharacterized protein [Paramormyrops kingsleyae]|uniref:uncharacterized protein isoform X1 n=1 Tax=Paramormyrops kingsleyae TaxID=1676925 RepID=UPI003B97324E
MQRDTLEYAFCLLLWSVHIFTVGLMNDCLEVGSSGLFPCTNSLSNESVLMTCSVQRTDGNICTITLDLDTYELSTCDPRMSLNITGLTVFLSISNIQQADEGNYSCEYAYSGGMNITDFNICVSESPTESNNGYLILLSCAVSIGMICIVILILWSLLLYHKRNRDSSDQATFFQSSTVQFCACRTQTVNLSSHTDQDMRDFEPYSTFIQKDDGFYSVAILSNINP